MNKTTLSLTMIILILIVAIFIQYELSNDLKKQALFSHQRSEQLNTELRNSKTKIELLSNNSYDVKKIKTCMHSSSVRQQVIHSIVYDTRKLTPLENIEYQKLLPVISKSKNSSSQTLLFQLIDESSKIDDECLKYANRVINA